MEPNHQHMEGLPLSLVSPVDLGRLLRELDSLNNQLQELALRSGGKELQLPRTTHMLDEVVSFNKLNLLLEADRATLKTFLTTIRTRAPRLHISFSADPSPLFIEKLMTWLRREVHPVVLITIGLQPSIGAGCVVRSTNKYFDLSLGKDFEDKRDLLMAKLRETITPAAPSKAAPTYIGPTQPPATATTAPVQPAETTHAMKVEGVAA